MIAAAVDAAGGCQKRRAVGFWHPCVYRGGAAGCLAARPGPNTREQLIELTPATEATGRTSGEFRIHLPNRRFHLHRNAEGKCRTHDDLVTSVSPRAGPRRGNDHQAGTPFEAPQVHYDRSQRASLLIDPLLLGGGSLEAIGGHPNVTS